MTFQNDPSIMSMLYGKPVHAHMYFRRIPVEEVPEDENDVSKWLQDLYVEKVSYVLIPEG